MMLFSDFKGKQFYSFPQVSSCLCIGAKSDFLSLVVMKFTEKLIY